jgi:predicted cupin superfamily sugar epimerase
MAHEATVQDIIDDLRLEPLAVCNGYFRETWRDEHATVIYWLLPESHRAVLHAAAHPEVFTYHSGAALRLTLLHPDGRMEEVLVGPDLPAGQRPHVVVPAGVWQAAHTTGSHTLTSVVVAPPFVPDIVTTADADALGARYPQHAETIRGLC